MTPCPPAFLPTFFRIFLNFFVSLFLLIFLGFLPARAAVSVEELSWDNGDTLLKFLQRNKLPSSLYYNLDKQDQELSSEIASRVKYQILKDDEGEIQQVLIPISDDLQIHIHKDEKGDFILAFSPVSYTREERVLALSVKSSAYADVYEKSGSTTLARAMVRAFRGSVNFRAMQPGDRVVLYYSQKRRLGRLWGDIDMKMASVEINKNEKKVYFYNDTFYDKNGKEVESFLLTKPLNYTRISSPFSLARYHPVLKRYRAHLGIDYAAPYGTPVRSAGKGVISYIGSQSGYGNVVKITHASGYVTLYGHLSRFAKIKKGQRVSQGQLIGYVGSTGMSTGPHLHFGVYLNNRAINPASVVKIAKSQLSKKEREKFQAAVAGYERIVSQALARGRVNPPREEEFENFMEF